VHQLLILADVQHRSAPGDSPGALVRPYRWAAMSAMSPPSADYKLYRQQLRAVYADRWASQEMSVGLAELVNWVNHLSLNKH
jgi:hypothetical protein